MIREAVRIQVFIYICTWFGYLNMYIVTTTLETTFEDRLQLPPSFYYGKSLNMKYRGDVA